MDAMKSKICIKNLEKTFHSDGRSLTALRDLSLEIEDEEFFGIVEPRVLDFKNLLGVEHWVRIYNPAPLLF